MSKPSELAAAFGVPPGLVEIIEGIDDINKSKPKAGPDANKKKQFGGGESSGQPGKDGADAAGGLNGGPGPGGPGGPGAMMSDDAVKQMQQQQADQQAAEMQARQAKDAEEEAERMRLKELKTKAEKEVADDLNDKYVDADDKIEFYPKMESFSRFVKEEKRDDYLCRACGYKTSRTKAPSECPKCHKTQIWLDKTHGA